MKCFCCGKEYSYCPNCPKDKDKDASIYTMFDSERCKKIFGILTAQSLGKKTNEESLAELRSLNVTSDENFKEAIKNHIQLIFDSEIKPIEEDVAVSVDEYEEEVEAPTTEPHTVFKRKNKYKRIVNVLGDD